MHLAHQQLCFLVNNSDFCWIIRLQHASAAMSRLTLAMQDDDTHGVDAIVLRVAEPVITTFSQWSGTKLKSKRKQP